MTTQELEILNNTGASTRVIGWCSDGSRGWAVVDGDYNAEIATIANAWIEAQATCYEGKT